MFFACGFSITLGYHRLYSHLTFQALTGRGSDNSKSERWYTQDNCVARCWAASKAPFYSLPHRQKWSQTRCPRHLCPVQCARSSIAEQGESDQIGSSALQEKLQYERESLTDSGHRYTRSRIGLGFPMTGKRLLLDARANLTGKNGLGDS
jgi:hypothetical protein